jgi:prepilin-type N-terminal cleavage/methylation domain-containing protein
MLTNLLNSKGFTVLELVIVISIIALLFSITTVFINPVERINAAYDASKSSDMRVIERASHQFFIDQSSYAPLNITTEFKEICDTGFDSAEEVTSNCAGLINLARLVPTYVVAIPANPIKNEGPGAGYAIKITEGNQIELIPTNESVQEINLQVLTFFDLENVQFQIILIILLIIFILGLVTYYIIKAYSRNNT